MLITIGFSLLSAYFSFHITSYCLEEREQNIRMNRMRNINQYYNHKRKYISRINRHTLSKEKKRKRNKTISLPIRNTDYKMRKQVSFSYIRDMEYIPCKEELQDKHQLWYSTRELLNFKYTNTPENLKHVLIH